MSLSPRLVVMQLTYFDSRRYFVSWSVTRDVSWPPAWQWTTRARHRWWQQQQLLAKLIFGATRRNCVGPMPRQGSVATARGVSLLTEWTNCDLWRDIHATAPSSVTRSMSPDSVHTDHAATLFTAIPQHHLPLLRHRQAARLPRQPVVCMPLRCLFFCSSHLALMRLWSSFWCSQMMWSRGLSVAA